MKNYNNINKLLHIFCVFLCLFCVLFFTQNTNAQKTAQNESKIEKPVKSKFTRIVSLKPNITQILMALGLSDYIVGVTKYCPKPNDHVQIVADYNNVDLEAVVRLKPDLVLISPENSQSRQFMALKGAKLNLKLYHFRNYEEMKDSLLKISDLVGLWTKGKKLVWSMDNKLQKLSQMSVLENGLIKSFIVIVQRRPLIVAAGNSYISSLLETAGLKNAFSANKISFPVLDEEELIRENVNYTFDMSHKPEDQDHHFLNKEVIALNIQDFLATPQSVDNLVSLIQNLP